MLKKALAEKAPLVTVVGWDGGNRIGTGPFVMGLKR